MHSAIDEMERIRKRVERVTRSPALDEMERMRRRLDVMTGRTGRFASIARRSRAGRGGVDFGGLYLPTHHAAAARTARRAAERLTGTTSAQARADMDRRLWISYDRARWSSVHDLYATGTLAVQAAANGPPAGPELKRRPGSQTGRACEGRSRSGGGARRRSSGGGSSRDGPGGDGGGGSGGGDPPSDDGQPPRRWRRWVLVAVKEVPTVLTVVVTLLWLGAWVGLVEPPGVDSPAPETHRHVELDGSQPGAVPVKRSYGPAGP